MTEYVKHPLIKPETLELREYQLDLSSACASENTLLILPTGLGKTIIALLTAAEILFRNPEGRCLILAPTRVLVHQHQTFCSRYFVFGEEGVESVTGEDSPYVRRERWSKRIVCATPQITWNDIRRGYVDLKRVSLIVFDEAHRAVGDYPYCSIAAEFMKVKPEGRAVGMTASIPSDESKVQGIMGSLGLRKIQVRDEKSLDVEPYVQQTRVDWVKIDLPPIFTRIRDALDGALQSYVKVLVDGGLLKGDVNLRALLDLRERVGHFGSYESRAALFSAIRLSHSLSLLETQGLSPMKKFFDKLFAKKRGLGVKWLRENHDVKEAYEAARGALMLGVEHPKIRRLEEVLKGLKVGEKALVFTSYRDSVDGICRRLSDSGFKVGHLVGKSGDTGLSQFEQIQALSSFKQGAFNILVATQVGEEGLDVPECNLVVFYDNVPSAIRFIQRRGRTGRRSAGRVVILLTRGSKDEAYYWSAKRRLLQAKKIVEDMGRSKDEDTSGRIDMFM